jgi:hypothetical protein
VEEIVDLESVAYNRRRKDIVRRSKKIKIIDIDNIVICTIEDPFLDTERANISEIIFFGVTISYDTIDKARVEENEK